MKKNDIISLTIHSLTDKGDGYAHHHNHTIYIPNTLPGETVKTLILKVNKNHAFGKCLTITDPHPHRQLSPCPISLQCGGCQLLHQTYKSHLEWKQKTLTHILDPLPLQTIKPSPHITGFRNKAQFAFQRDPQNKLRLGLYARGSHRVINTKHCEVQHPSINDVLEHCHSFFQNTPLSCYDDTTQTGLLRYLVIRTTTQNETMVALVTTDKNIPHLDDWITTMKSIPHVKSIFLNVNTQKSDSILGEQSTLLWGHSTIKEQFKDTQFTISLPAFFQLNSGQTQVLYEDILKIVTKTAPKHVLDLYCGSGSIGLYATPKTTPLTGIEVNPQSIIDATENATLNHHPLTSFIHGTVEDSYPSLSVSSDIAPDIVIIDPPRKGCDPIVIQTLTTHLPNTIIYVSCNPHTLYRDLKLLQDTYTIDHIQPYDMFPFTPHIEVMVTLKRKGINNRIKNN
jgi:23S rRNA (uracil1939-C5)-methyltransferase